MDDGSLSAVGIDGPGTGELQGPDDAERPAEDEQTDDEDVVDEDDDEADLVVGVLVLGLFAVAAAVIIGLFVLWPRGAVPETGLGIGDRSYVNATVVAVQEDVNCPGMDPEYRLTCVAHTVRVTSGDAAGESGVVSTMPGRPGLPELSVGDDVVLQEFPDTPAPFRYQFADFQRSTPMLWLLGVFVLVVLAFGRWQGARALVGLAFSLVILVVFVVPSLVRDSSTLAVALVGATVVAFAAIYLSHGFNLASSIALVGTLVSLAITAVLALLVVAMAHLTGVASTDAQLLETTVGALNWRGLIVAGIVVGALGILDDVTVTQVSTVKVLCSSNPDLGRVALYRRALQVGRDHVAAAVNTLVLAYAGAALPLLMYFANGPDPVSRILTSELVAVEIIRMLVGSIGLVLSVPITTGLAAMVLGAVTRAYPDEQDFDDAEVDPHLAHAPLTGHH